MKTIFSKRTNEKVAGIFFISATVSAIIGVLLYEPVLSTSGFLVNLNQFSYKVTLGAVFELILAISNIGTAIMLYPFLKMHDDSWGLGYACFRLLEVVFILIGVTCMLSIVNLGNNYAYLSDYQKNLSQETANVFKMIYGWVFILGPHFMLGINTFIYSMIFYKTKMVPGRMAILGISGAILIFIAAILEIFNIIHNFSLQLVIFAFPIAVYEMILAYWLIKKGFRIQRNEYI